MSEALEFSRTLPWVAVGPEGRRQRVEANEQERAALARRFGIPAIHAFSAELELREEKSGGIRARGRLRAEVVQSCVVTLEPVTQSLDEPVDLRFLPPGADLSDDPDGPDEIETEERGVMQLGEALAEQLSLALDPYPRAPGAELAAVLPEDQAEPEEAAPQRPNPFAVLKRP